jgi:hypothetical protein
MDDNVGIVEIDELLAVIRAVPHLQCFHWMGNFPHLPLSVAQGGSFITLSGLACLTSLSAERALPSFARTTHTCYAQNPVRSTFAEPASIGYINRRVPIGHRQRSWLLAG